MTVRSEDETVRVAKERGFLLVEVNERRGNEHVLVKMPIGVVEALLGGDDGKLDLAAAIRRLGDFDGEDLVVVESDDSKIRIWIDADESGD